MVTWVLRLCVITFGVTMLFAAWNGFVENREFRAQGQRATVEPLVQYTETTTTKKKLGIKVGESKSKSAELTFTTQDGRRITVQRNLPDSVFDKFAAGEPVAIEIRPTATIRPPTRLTRLPTATVCTSALAAEDTLQRRQHVGDAEHGLGREA